MHSKSFKFALLSFLFVSSAALAAPPNTITLDGRPIEYDASELVGTNPQSPFSNFGPGNLLTNLFVTWDSTYLYVAVQGQEVNDKLALLIDVDPGNGTGATTTTNWTSTLAEVPGYIKFNDTGWIAAEAPAAAFGLDYQIASEGFFNNVMRVRYNGVDTPTTNNVDSLFDTGNGTTPQNTPVDMVILSNGSADPLKGFEARIPWTVLYTNGWFGTVEAGELVPRGATLRMFAVLHNNDPGSSWSSDAIIPNQVSAGSSYADGKWTTADYVDVVVDTDTNGLPDVAVGDVNAPYLTFATGVQGKRQVYLTFNEEVDSVTAADALNWMVGEADVGSASQVLPNAVLLNLTNDLPASGTLVKIQSSGVEDLTGNSKVSTIYLNPAASGIETSVTVRFMLVTNSGFGASAATPRATNFFINGGSAPLSFGYPPDTGSPLTPTTGGMHYRDVTFPPGTPLTVFYKYSGELTTTGTNTYEAVRLDNYSGAARQLLLPTNGTSFLVVTDWLGAVAAPFRDPNTNTGYNAVYTDTRRGDAGVRQRTAITFQLDMNGRDLTGITRIMVMGTDPLRGFNLDNANFSDFPGTLVTWDTAGLELVDDGTKGDAVAGDGIFSRQWIWSTNGADAVAEPGFPNSLVGGDGGTSPYFGFGWFDGRSPRSFKYKYFVYRSASAQNFDSPASDIEYYIPADVTNIVLDPFIWANDNLPPPPPSNSPVLVDIDILSGQRLAVFEGTDPSHGVEISTNLMVGWSDYGTRAVTSAVPGVWQATIRNPTDVEHYRAFSGGAKPYRGMWVWPNPIPETGGVMTVFYNQHSRALAGYRNNFFLRGNFNGWGTTIPMTFLGDGWWKGEVEIASNFVNAIQFKTYGQDADAWEGSGWGPDGNVAAYRGSLRATWTPMMPTNGEILTVTYDQAGGPLAAATNVNAHYGFTEVWNDAGQRPMTNIGGTLWQIAFAIPTNAHTSVNMVFTDGTTWDSESGGGRYWRMYIKQPGYPEP